MDDDLHLTRLSIEDLAEVALKRRLVARGGDKEATAIDIAIAEAIESVVRQRHAVAVVRARIAAARRAWAPVRRAAEWAVSRR